MNPAPPHTPSLSLPLRGSPSLPHSLALALTPPFVILMLSASAAAIFTLLPITTSHLTPPLYTPCCFSPSLSLSALSLSLSFSLPPLSALSLCMTVLEEHTNTFLMSLLDLGLVCVC